MEWYEGTGLSHAETGLSNSKAPCTISRELVWITDCTLASLDVKLLAKLRIGGELGRERGTPPRGAGEEPWMGEDMPLRWIPFRRSNPVAPKAWPAFCASRWTLRSFCAHPVPSVSARASQPRERLRTKSSKGQGRTLTTMAFHLAAAIW
eukprot:3705832-Rhodomonas_salina.3